jgi:hypothetical protein
MPNFYNYQANDPTSDSGPSNASILTFSGNTNDSFIKELTQNSLDARLVTSTGKLSLKIRMIEIKKTDIPNFSELESIINQMELLMPNGKCLPVVNAFCNAEMPGAFIIAINHFMRTKCVSSDFDWLASAYLPAQAQQAQAQQTQVIKKNEISCEAVPLLGKVSMQPLLSKL